LSATIRGRSVVAVVPTFWGGSRQHWQPSKYCIPIVDREVLRYGFVHSRAACRRRVPSSLYEEKTKFSSSRSIWNRAKITFWIFAAYIFLSQLLSSTLRAPRAIVWEMLKFSGRGLAERPCRATTVREGRAKPTAPSRLRLGFSAGERRYCDSPPRIFNQSSLEILSTSSAATRVT
jgi:hypothetical protein